MCVSRCAFRDVRFAMCGSRCAVRDVRFAMCVAGGRPISVPDRERVHQAIQSRRRRVRWESLLLGAMPLLRGTRPSQGVRLVSLKQDCMGAHGVGSASLLERGHDRRGRSLGYGSPTSRRRSRRAAARSTSRRPAACGRPAGARRVERCASCLGQMVRRLTDATTAPASSE
jgi:hypothetical protein